MNLSSFYCENCSREVSAGLDICPSCGLEFASVQCPNCGFTGVYELFKEGCPECGYTSKNEMEKHSCSELHIVKQVGNGYKDSGKALNQLPSWLYKVFVALMIIVIVILVRSYFLV